jgi:hypothetical protein
MAPFTGVSNMTNHEVEAKRVAEDVQAFLRSGGKVTVIPRGVSGECDLTITEARKLIKERALSARSAA